MSDIVTTFQSRLSAKLNNIERKLVDNAIRLQGVATDCICIRTKKTPQGDIESRTITSIDAIPVIFPSFTDVPLMKYVRQTGEVVKMFSTFEKQPFEMYIPSQNEMSQEDLLIKFYENENNIDPYISVIEIKDLLGTFGARSLIYHKYKGTFYDEVLPDAIMNFAVDMARRRQILHW